ncbi:thiopurine S-methyltransferase [Pseudomonas petrae]|uniref:Thiopurine S-methyltransferase n=1 Tax=Pseudomonas petrae TaxID=2912190 RepID=A0ABS9I8W1_9PSED|nr:thiopurine S-methyltransferase [Pseudomonas petrae]MCF7534051.1 thiopurine S-methyltransferase [Pseudomonas petrae]MCF7539404.1 thiopurine S-methyltransferase [Pseudomonas petrae]MCF7543634.1 thiopurine S-methyltransferase [Pseudomonas petrae]MCF7557289.1 thiopurine S-methyltransferase [Pseudomonas petrae]
MEPRFWHERWAINQIGFNQASVNSHLLRLWAELTAMPGERVLVPLCGKSIDMIWLLNQGFHVVGAELSEIAVAGFFSENGLQATIEERGAFKVHRTERCEIWCGDFFALKPEDIGDCTAFYDRAALIALPPDLRWRYVKQLNHLLSNDACGLLVTLDYDQSLIAGPPFSVDEDEVLQLLSPDWRVKRVADLDVLEQGVKFKQAGATSLMEYAYRLYRR